MKFKRLAQAIRTEDGDDLPIVRTVIHRVNKDNYDKIADCDMCHLEGVDFDKHKIFYATAEHGFRQEHPVFLGEFQERKDGVYEAEVGREGLVAYTMERIVEKIQYELDGTQIQVVITNKQ